MTSFSIYPWAAISTLVTAAAFAGALLNGNAFAQTTAEAAPKKIALISMVGDEFSVVTQKQSVGSNIIDNFHRQTVRVPGQGLNLSVLRGLDQAVGREFPDSERVLLAIPHSEEPSNISPKDRERVAYEKAVSAISKMPQRMEWDRIVLVTPRWLFSQRQGMASKLSGIGMYVQPLESAKFQDNTGQSDFSNEFGLMFEDEVDTPTRGETRRSKTFIAPFFYAVVTTLDAKTMSVIKREERYDFKKIVDPESTAIRIQNQFEPEQLAGLVDKFIETAAIRSVTDKKGTVEIGPLRSTLVPQEKK